jgi:hypothetical protein
MIRNVFVAGLSAACALAVFTSAAADKEKKPIAVDIRKIPPASERKDLTYAADIKPILEASCIKCHGPEKPKGKLRLDSLEGVLKGGQDGKVVQPGSGASSLLVVNVAHLGDPDDYMPPPNNKANIPPLTGEQIGLFRAWIDQGAK